MPELRTIPIDKIKIPDVRVSSILNDEQKAFLSSTIREIGVIQDPVVRALPDGSYEVIAGKSRIQELAAQGAAEVQCKVIEADEKTSLLMNIVENIARGSYDYISISRAIRKLRELGTSYEELEKVFPWKKRWIEFIEQLQDLPDDVVEALRTKKITPTHVQVALALPTPYEVHDALRSAVNLGWSSSVLKTFVENRLEQIQRAKMEAAAKGVEPVIPKANPQELVQYKQCLVCGYKKPADQVTVQLICEDCLNIARYVAANLGSSPDTLNTIYAALQAYFGPPQGYQRLPEKSREVSSQG
ncbi:MAG: hypothetical protein DRJ38_07270 [Thermoprotei archaeon]|nr:MAG: hypothetical protein DRJ38_07270 [Thermoprotei archaeon]